MKTEDNSKINIINLKMTNMTKQVNIKYAIKQGTAFIRPIKHKVKSLNRSHTFYVPLQM